MRAIVNREVGDAKNHGTPDDTGDSGYGEHGNMYINGGIQDGIWRNY